jgi:predicted DsbA family dithiol-disulfide isomerase
MQMNGVRSACELSSPASASVFEASHPGNYHRLHLTVVLSLYRAYSVDGLNIAIPDNLITVARQLALPEDEALDVLTSRRFRDAVDADWRRCRSLGVTAVPTFVVGNKGVVGAQPYEALEKLVVEGGAVKR